MSNSAKRNILILKYWRNLRFKHHDFVFGCNALIKLRVNIEKFHWNSACLVCLQVHPLRKQHQQHWTTVCNTLSNSANTRIKRSYTDCVTLTRIDAAVVEWLVHWSSSPDVLLHLLVQTSTTKETHWLLLYKALTFQCTCKWIYTWHLVERENAGRSPYSTDAMENEGTNHSVLRQ